MRAFLILAACVGVALAGVGQLSPEQERAILAQFASLCQSSDFPEQGQEIDGVFTYCKRGPGKRVQRFETESRISLPGAKPQSVLVQPPPQEYIHLVKVDARVKGPRNKVYVVPGQVENRYRVEVEANTERPTKPVVYFVKEKRSEGEQLSKVNRRPSERPPQPSVHFLSTDWLAEEEVTGGYPDAQSYLEVDQESAGYPVPRVPVLAQDYKREAAQTGNDKPVLVIKEQEA